MPTAITTTASVTITPIRTLALESLITSWTIACNGTLPLIAYDGKLMLNNVITYDLEKLEQMDAQQLAIQMIARQDLHMPKREHKLQAQGVYNALKADVKAFLAEVEELGIPQLSINLEATAKKFFTHKAPEVVE